jgi:hypothetical protein
MAQQRKTASNGATLGFEETLWAAADQLRGHSDTLLPKLISGELRVPDAENLVGESQ